MLCAARIEAHVPSLWPPLSRSRIPPAFEYPFLFLRLQQVPTDGKYKESVYPEENTVVGIILSQAQTRRRGFLENGASGGESLPQSEGGGELSPGASDPPSVLGHRSEVPPRSVLLMAQQ